jgi:hypothetical protein
MSCLFPYWVLRILPSVSGILDFIPPTLRLAVTFLYFILPPGETRKFPHLQNSVSYTHSFLDFRRIRFQDPQRRAKIHWQMTAPQNYALASPSHQKHCDVNSMNMYRSQTYSSSRAILMLLSIKRTLCCISVFGPTPAKKQSALSEGRVYPISTLEGMTIRYSF